MKSASPLKSKKRTARRVLEELGQQAFDFEADREPSSLDPQTTIKHKRKAIAFAFAIFIFFTGSFSYSNSTIEFTKGNSRQKIEQVDNANGLLTAITNRVKSISGLFYFCSKLGQLGEVISYGVAALPVFALNWISRMNLPIGKMVHLLFLWVKVHF